ncbi:GNAT family N-acetyltransferase [Suttonella sp. R2A3]|uniref:GNAT family N-acetyltransferase n=1 Tax=Suttonella sp. R2A3 TaxID=2908648 RepID=UPI001F2190C9|nr:GNAT family N-acetyltransferase [Suttonella sp. R2A3]UJF25183.1 GNAT family N-acetyltransferase [Suttonella sp. R2A3]
MRATFALLRHAHYRHSPADLKRLLDLPAQQLWLMEHDSAVIGVLHVLHESPLPPELIEAVIDGTRRPQGRLLMQQLLRRTGKRTYGMNPLNRIQRIAVHPDFRRQGIARALISAASHELSAPLGASYAKNDALEHFWHALGFYNLTANNQQRSTSNICLEVNAP